MLEFFGFALAALAVFFAFVAVRQTLPKVRSCEIRHAPFKSGGVFCKLLIDPGSSPTHLSRLSAPSRQVAHANISAAGTAFLAGACPSTRSIPLDAFVSETTGPVVVTVFVPDFIEGNLSFLIWVKSPRWFFISFKTKVTKPEKPNEETALSALQ